MTFSREHYIRHPAGVEIDMDLLRRFEDELNPAAPETHAIPSQVLGYGEISTVFEIKVAPFAGLALKRMAVFETAVELTTYLTAYNEYHWLLEDEIGIKLPAHGYAALSNKNRPPIFYIMQQKVDVRAIGNHALASLSPNDAAIVFNQVLREMNKVWVYNQSQTTYQVALDGQISNWAIAHFDPTQSTLLYIDTSTPLYRISSVEQINAELFLRPAPSFLRWILRRFFLADVVGRYYDLRRVIIDLLANLYKEQLTHLIPDFIQAANQFFEQELADLGLHPITPDEVAAYYREDKQIWSLYASMRQLDRFLHNRVFRKQYPYILPGKVRR
ncbi:MAG: hypothetical protein KJ069_22560 [Anaerolineae bacterium]|nr:hypothetical protein [Anaerolineae bacterium]